MPQSPSKPILDSSSLHRDTEHAKLLLGDDSPVLAPHAIENHRISLTTPSPHFISNRKPKPQQTTRGFELDTTPLGCKGAETHFTTSRPDLKRWKIEQTAQGVCTCRSQSIYNSTQTICLASRMHWLEAVYRPYVEAFESAPPSP